MNKQDIFDKVCTHLLTQNMQALGHGLDGGLKCSYKTKTGLKCAIGALIPDGHPAFSHEGGVVSLLNKFPDLGDILGINSEDYNGDLAFLSKLQFIHDSVDLDKWESRLIKFANDHELEFNYKP